MTGRTRSLIAVRCGTFAAALLLTVAAAAQSQGGGEGGTALVSEKAFPTGQRATSVLLMERRAPVEVRAGAQMLYSVTITNITHVPLADVVLTEQYPASMTVAGVSPQPTQSAGGRGSWTIPTLAPGQSTTIRVSGVAGAAGESVTGCATVTFSAAICSTTPVVEPRLALTKSAPAEVLLCDEIAYRLVVTNTGTGIARQVRVEDALPNGLTSTEGRAALSFDGGDLAPGQSREFTFRARASATGSFTNTARAAEAGGRAVEASATTMVRVPKLVLSKRGPDVRFIGRPLEYEITVQNSGDAPAVNTIVTDTLPGAAARFVSADQGGQYSGGRVTWSLGTLAPGEQRTVRVVLTPTQRSMLRNEASAQAVCANAAAAAATEIKGVPAILLEVVDVHDPIEIGSEETYEISVVNQGTADGTNIVVQCELPPQQDYLSARGPTTARESGRVITFEPLPVLAPKARAVFTINSRGTTAGDTRFKVTLKSDQMDSVAEETESTHVY